jgi:hypothetical protein
MLGKLETRYGNCTRYYDSGLASSGSHEYFFETQFNNISGLTLTCFNTKSANRKKVCEVKQQSDHTCSYWDRYAGDSLRNYSLDLALHHAFHQTHGAAEVIPRLLFAARLQAEDQLRNIYSEIIVRSDYEVKRFANPQSENEGFVELFLNELGLIKKIRILHSIPEKIIDQTMELLEANKDKYPKDFPTPTELRQQLLSGRVCEYEIILISCQLHDPGN